MVGAYIQHFEAIPYSRRGYLQSRSRDIDAHNRPVLLETTLIFSTYTQQYTPCHIYDYSQLYNDT